MFICIFRHTLSRFEDCPKSLNTIRSATAVLLFTRSASGEAAHKCFVEHGAGGANAAVAAQLIEQATEAAQQTGVDFLCVESSQQVGRSFGERLTAAVAYGFALGYEQLVVIGNDCPALGAKQLRQAVHALETADAVLGPAADGGVYLLGVNRNSFDAASWARLPWQTGRLGKALAGCLLRNGATVYTLGQLADIDTAQDLARVLLQLPEGRLRTRLRRLRAVPKLRVRRQLLGPTEALTGLLPQRAPPAH